MCAVFLKKSLKMGGKPLNGDLSLGLDWTWDISPPFHAVLERKYVAYRFGMHRNKNYPFQTV